MDRTPHVMHVDTAEGVLLPSAVKAQENPSIGHTPPENPSIGHTPPETLQTRDTSTNQSVSQDETLGPAQVIPPNSLFSRSSLHTSPFFSSPFQPRDVLYDQEYSHESIYYPSFSQQRPIWNGLRHDYNVTDV